MKRVTDLAVVLSIRDVMEYFSFALFAFPRFTRLIIYNQWLNWVLSGGGPHVYVLLSTSFQASLFTSHSISSHISYTLVSFSLL